MFNTLAFVKKMTEAGMPRNQAEVHAEFLAKAVAGKPAFKEDMENLYQAIQEDLQEIKREIAQVKTYLETKMP